MSPVLPFSLNFAIKWPPLIDFLEHRTAILRWFDERELLHSFTTSEGRVGVRLSEHEALEFFTGRCEVFLATPAADWSRVEEALVNITDLLGVEAAVLVSGSAQILAPIADGDLALATRLFSSLVSIAPALEVSSTDAAVLVDGRTGLADGTLLDYQVEFGVIGPSEALPRLVRSIGRMTRMETQPLADAFDSSEFPDISVFADWSFFPAASHTEGSDLKAVLADVLGFCEFSNGATAQIEERLITDG